MSLRMAFVQSHLQNVYFVASRCVYGGIDIVILHSQHFVGLNSKQLQSSCSYKAFIVTIADTINR